MSRALRRHPQGSKRNKRQRDAKAQSISPSTGSQPKRESSSSGRRGLAALRPTWAIDIVSELQKVSWPSAADTRYLTIVVLIVGAAFGIFLGGVDIFFNWFIENTLLR
jgi:preprotein translocase SecE subunit